MIEIGVQPKPRRAGVAQEPSHYLVLGDFGGRAAGPVSVDRDNLDQALANAEVNLAGMQIRELEDFHPDRLYQRLDFFRGLREPEPDPPPARPEAAPRADIPELLRSRSLLEQIAGAEDPFRKYVEELAHSGAAPEPARKPGNAAAERMRAVLHEPRFQAVEAAWRGLDLVVRGAEDESARIHIAQFSRRELEADLAEATDLSGTRAYALLHGREWRAVIGLYSFDAAGIELLGRLALVTAHARAPFLAEGSVDMGPLWEQLRSIPEAGSIGLALPRFLLRLPYGRGVNTVESFEFEESPAHPQKLWGNPALACLAMLSSASEELNGQGVEVLLTESQVAALIELGLIPLVGFRDSDRMRVAGLRAINGRPLV